MHNVNGGAREVAFGSPVHTFINLTKRDRILTLDKDIFGGLISLYEGYAKKRALIGGNAGYKPSLRG